MKNVLQLLIGLRMLIFVVADGKQRQFVRIGLLNLSLLIPQVDVCPTIVAKQRWGGRLATAVDYQILPIRYVIVHHTVTNGCTKKSKCAGVLTNMQTYHMDQLNYQDIGYK